MALTLGAGLCVVQGDLGSAVVLAGIVFAVMFIVGTPFTPMGLAAGGFTAVGLAFGASSPRRFARWTAAFLDLEGNKEHTSYQVYQAIISIANGGPTGVGVGEGTGKWGYVPLAHSQIHLRDPSRLRNSVSSASSPSSAVSPCSPGSVSTWPSTWSGG